ENLHYKFAIALYTNHIENKVTPQTLHKMLRDAVNTELIYVKDSLYGVKLIGMKESDMCLYVKHIANMICKDLGVPKP
ncbi:MAG: ribonucleoside-diphosphate reductase, partial [Candidatus Scalindua sp.]|nr:ribonucleoside-diphosphate reductase [Candidatus Scalindua sp.]